MPVSLMPILLVAMVLAVDNGLGFNIELPPMWTALIACGGPMLLVMLSWVGNMAADRRLARGRIRRSLYFAEWMQTACRWGIFINHGVAVLVFNWLGVIRAQVGDLILVDEVLALTPPLLGLIGLYWTHYPIEKRLRDAVLIRQLDRGAPVFPTLTRGRYVLLQTRMQLLLLLVPVLLIAGLTEMLNGGLPASTMHALPAWGWRVVAVAGGAGIFLAAPLLARVLLDVEPLASGSIRDDLQEVCRQHRVRTRDLLLWKTNGSMINAAVMGLIGALRYVLITDMLLETLRRDQVRAVMAHEVGHVRRHHMVWMIVCLMACLAIGSMIAMVMARGGSLLVTPSDSAAQGVMLGTYILQYGIGFWIFGWISRRFERQADTFAVQHLSEHPLPAGAGSATPPDAEFPSAQPGASPSDRVTEHSIRAMQGALHTIAELNAIAPDRPSWRHGSIGWRLRYLHSIIGKPVNALRIDRVVRRIKLAAVVVLAAAMAWEMWIAPRNEAEGRHESDRSAGEVSPESASAAGAQADDGNTLNRSAS